MRRLYWRLYTGIVLVIVIFALMVGALRVLDPDDRRRDATVASVAATVAELLPPAGAPPAELDATLERLARRFDADAAVYDAVGTRAPRAAVGDPVPLPPDDGSSGWVHGPRGAAFALALPDGRWLVARRHGARRGGPWVAALALLALAIAIGAHPLARRITRRLERLQAQVDALGAGDLSSRVTVEGRDEVAELARAFNRAAGRIEALVAAQRSTLAGASHELRSPLARIRMAVELSAERLRPDLCERLERDVAELDELIGELLLASRVQAGDGSVRREAVALLTLLEEEAARVGASVCGEPTVLHGDPRLLRRLLRNLLENAARHGGGTAIEARVDTVARPGMEAAVEITVEDRGPGVPEALRERIFEPFFRPPGLREGEDHGVGLGLALVRQIAQHHGGEARCEPRDGGGTRLRVRLPPMPVREGERGVAR